LHVQKTAALSSYPKNSQLESPSCKLSSKSTFSPTTASFQVLSNILFAEYPEDELYVLNEKGLFSKKVELVGMAKISAKQQKLDGLKQVSLNNSFIRTADDQIHSTTPLIEDIDLAGNLFTSWETVITMTVQLPYLEVLNLGNNRLAYPPESLDISQAFLKLRILVLNYCNIKSLDEVSFDLKRKCDFIVGKFRKEYAKIERVAFVLQWNDLSV
jgi:hypothetical protein